MTSRVSGPDPLCRHGNILELSRQQTRCYEKDVTEQRLYAKNRLRRSVAKAYGAACLGLAGHSAFLAPLAEPAREPSDDGMVIAFLSSEVARETAGALIMSFAMAM